MPEGDRQKKQGQQRHGRRPRLERPPDDQPPRAAHQVVQHRQADRAQRDPQPEEIPDQVRTRKNDAARAPTLRGRARADRRPPRAHASATGRAAAAALLRTSFFDRSLGSSSDLLEAAVILGGRSRTPSRAGSIAALGCKPRSPSGPWPACATHKNTSCRSPGSSRRNNGRPASSVAHRRESSVAG